MYVCLYLAEVMTGNTRSNSLNAAGNLLSLRVKANGAVRSAGMLYTFLLVASRADMDSQRKLENLDPASLFEQLCADVLLNFWGGRTELSGSMVFGTARKKLPST